MVVYGTFFFFQTVDVLGPESVEAKVQQVAIAFLHR
jgi:hypothetical protein